MFKTIEQAVEAYKKEISAYKNWSDKVKAKYGHNSQNPIRWVADDYYRNIEWKKEISVRQKSLGLNKKEVKKIFREVGLSL